MSTTLLLASRSLRQRFACSRT